STLIFGSGAGVDGDYNWSGGVENGIEFTPVTTSMYYLIGTDVNGCQNNDSVQVLVYDLPNVFAGEDFAICMGDSAVLTGSGAGDDGIYTWDEAVLNNVTFAPELTLTYTVTGEDVNGCINTDEITITVNNLPL